MKIILFFLLLVPSLQIFAGDWGCTGNACNEVEFKFSNGCHQSTNLSSRKIKVVRGPWSKVLQPGETASVIAFGSCLKTYIGDDTAVYVN